MRTTAAVVLLAVPLGCVQYRAEPLAPAQGLATLEARSLSDSGLRAFVARNVGPSRDSSAAWDLTALTLAAFYYSPDLDVARARFGIAQAGVVTAGARPNPTLSVLPARTVAGLPRATAAGPALTPWALALSLDLPLELFHKRGYRIARARHLADSARFGIAATAWQVRDRVRGGLLDLSAAQSRAALERAVVGQREALVRLLEHRLALGEASQLDVSRERMLGDQARLDLSATERTVAEAQSGLAAAIGIPAPALDCVEFVSVARSRGNPLTADQSVELPSADSLRRLALLGRADMLALLAEYQAAESALQLEVARQYPDLRLLPGIAWDRGQRRLSLGASSLLPILNQNRGPIGEAIARRREVAARVLQLQARVLGQLDSALAGYRSAAREVAVADSLFAAQRAITAAVDAQFRAGEVGRVALVSAELEVTTIALSRLQALVAAQRVRGRLESAVQRPLFGGSVPAEQLERPPHGARALRPQAPPVPSLR